MSPLPLGLGSLLGAAAGIAGRAAPARAQDATALDFARLLEQAQRGEVDSGRPVTLGPGVEIELTEDQLERLGAAADRAEASGATTAVVLIDGEALVLDVRARTITGRIEPGSDEPLFGVDTVVRAPGAQPDAVGVGGPASHLVSNPSLLEALARRSA